MPRQTDPANEFEDDDVTAADVGRTLKFQDELWTRAMRNLGMSSDDVYLPKPGITCQNPSKPVTPASRLCKTNPTGSPSTVAEESPSNLPPRQLVAAQLLVRGWTRKAVAAHLNVNRQTVGAWCRRADFQAAVDRAARER